ncbi:MAG: zinc ribbon domain-containing protein [Ideonella sp.]|nr:zinc ribbon domain-containing protein [Ideonella sp.]MCC7455533.1 zinc ribbon domain-containing protein [Nitrospira sp.]
MPIYAYRCASCGHAKDVLQRISDPPLTECPACGAQTFSKQVTAAGFQLKGTGWYATDFKGGSKKATAGDGQGANGSTEAKPSESTKGEPTTTAGNSGSGSGESSAPAKSGDTAGAASSTVPKAAAAGDARP